MGSGKALFILVLLTLISCSTQKPRGYELQSQVWEEDFREDSTVKIYITGTKPIDSVDVNKLIFDIHRIELDEYPENLKVYARVYDSSGNFVTNMADPYKKDVSKKYFTHVTEFLNRDYKKREAPIKLFHVREFGANDSIPYNISLTVDYSGSMEGVKEVIFDATEMFVGMKMKYDNIAISSFNRDFDKKVPLLNDKQQILNLYKVKQNEGFGLFSALYDAVWNSIDILEKAPLEVPRVLVVFSDGDDNYSKQDLDSLLKRIKKEKVHIFAVAFGYSKDDNMRYLARQSGGKFYKAYSKKELVDIFRDIYMSLRYFYLINYVPPDYWGYHEVFASLNVPGRDDTLKARGEYGTDDEFPPWLRDKLLRDKFSAFEKMILFDFDSAVVKEESYPILDNIADAMLSIPELMLEVQGHTDNVGTAEYNQKLSENRASNVMSELIKRGISEKRLRSRGFGFSQPVATNDTPEGRMLNRRTKFIIIAR